MQTKNADVMKKVEQLGAHYVNNVANKFLKDEFRALNLDHRTWSDIETLTEKTALYKLEGFYMDDLYLKLYALALFVHAARTQLAGQLRSLVSAHSSRRTPQEKVLADIAANNFRSNLAVLADQLNDIFTMASREDAEHHKGKPTVLSKIPEMKEFGKLLVD